MRRKGTKDDMKMKKILIIHHAGSFGGGAVSLMHIIEALNEINSDFKVYCPTSPPNFYNYLSRHYDNIIPAKSTLPIFNHYNGGSEFILKASSLFNFYNLFRKKGITELEKVMNEVQPDIVVVNSMTLAWLGPILKRNNSIKLVCFHRETYAKGLLGIRTKIIKKIFKKYFDGIAFISSHDLKETGKVNGYTRVITDKVDVRKYYNYDGIKFNSKRFNVLFLGGMSRLKGTFIAIKAFNLLREGDAKLIVMNYSSKLREKKMSDCLTIRSKFKFILGLDYEKKVLKYIEKNSLWDKIEFVKGTASPEAYILSSDLIIFPSTKAHQARPIYEAGIARVPIILSDFINTQEFATNSFNCLTFPNGNAKVLGEKILYTMENKQEMKGIVERNYINSLERHNLSSLSIELKVFFNSI